ncbi:hypothetical protein NKH77_04630 [Streptomyces sp. M19]
MTTETLLPRGPGKPRSTMPRGGPAPPLRGDRAFQPTLGSGALPASCRCWRCW